MELQLTWCVDAITQSQASAVKVSEWMSYLAPVSHPIRWPFSSNIIERPNNYGKRFGWLKTVLCLSCYLCYSHQQDRERQYRSQCCVSLSVDLGYNELEEHPRSPLSFSPLMHHEEKEAPILQTVSRRSTIFSPDSEENPAGDLKRSHFFLLSTPRLRHSKQRSNRSCSAVLSESTAVVLNEH